MQPTSTTTSVMAGTDGAITTMVEHNMEITATQAAATLTGVLRKILENPAEPKFRKLNKQNAKVAEKVLGPRGAVALLCSVGFKTEGTLLLMADGAVDAAKLEYAIAQLATVAATKRAFEAAKGQAERDKRMVAHKKEQDALKKRKAQLKAAEDGDKAARRDPNWSAKIFEKNGKDMARLDLDEGGGG